MKKVYTAIILIVLLCGGVLSANYIFLQRHMNEVLKEDPRNDGISVWVYYKWFVNSSEINYELRSVSAENSSLDVSRVMLQFAEKVKDYDFSKVYLSYRGKDKFYLKGEYFKTLGQEYGIQNPVYTLRTIPENVYMLNGERAYSVWEGGLLGVMGKQMEDLSDFSKAWYLDDFIKSMSD